MELELECRLTGQNCQLDGLIQSSVHEISRLKQHLHTHPTVAHHYTALIQAYMNNGQWNKAGEILNQFEELQHTSIKNAQTSTSAQWIDRAQLMISVLKKTVSIQVQHSFGPAFTDLMLYNVGLQALRTQQYSQAIPLLQRVTTNIPNWPPGQYALALAYYYTQEYTLAAEWFVAVNQSGTSFNNQQKYDQVPVLVTSATRNFNLIVAHAEALAFVNDHRVPKYVAGVVDSLDVPTTGDPNTRNSMIELSVKEAMSFPTNPTHHQYTSKHKRNGLLIELGVWKGDSLRIIAAAAAAAAAATAATPSSSIHASYTVVGFDSFLGLPEDFAGGQFRRSAFSTQGKHPPRLPINVDIYQGWFNQTIESFFTKNTNHDVVFVHIDCDLYSSAFEALDVIARKLIVGSILQFDQYFGYPEWKDGEALAWNEISKKHGIAFELLRYHETKMTVRITAVSHLGKR